MVQELGAITVRGNHDEVALERFQSWKLTGTLDVSLSSAYILSEVDHFASSRGLAISEHW